MLPVLQIGPIALQTYGLFILFGAWLGMALAERFAGYHKVHPALIERVGLVGVIAFLVGGRLSFFGRYPGALLSQPLSFSLSISMFDISGGVMFCVIAAIVTVQIRRLNGWQVLDGFTPVIMVLHTSIWLANTASGDAYGVPTHAPWGIDLWGAVRQPVQIYFFVANLLLTALFLLRGGLFFRLNEFKDGSRFIAALFFMALTWVAFSPFLSQAEFIGGRVSVVQLGSWVIALICFIIFVKTNNSIINNIGRENG